MRLDELPPNTGTIICTDALWEKLLEQVEVVPQVDIRRIDTLMGIAVYHYPTAEECLGRAILMGREKGVVLLTEEVSDGQRWGRVDMDRREP